MNTIKMKNLSILPEHDDILQQLDVIQYEQHSFLRDALVTIKKAIDLAMKEDQPSLSLIKCREIFLELNEEIEVHFREEETVLFPLIRKMEQDNVITSDDCHNIESIVNVLEYENNHSFVSLHKLKEACHQYSFCPNSFEHYNKLMDLLRTFEKNLTSHARNETQHLYPAAIRKEKLLSYIPTNSSFHKT